jgi:hypothetical protein
MFELSSGGIWEVWAWTVAELYGQLHCSRTMRPKSPEHPVSGSGSQMFWTYPPIACTEHELAFRTRVRWVRNSRSCSVLGAGRVPAWGVSVNSEGSQYVYIANKWSNTIGFMHQYTPLRHILDK